MEKESLPISPAGAHLGKKEDLYVQEGRGGEGDRGYETGAMREAWQKIKITNLHPGELPGIALPGNSGDN